MVDPENVDGRDNLESEWPYKAYPMTNGIPYQPATLGHFTPDGSMKMTQVS